MTISSMSARRSERKTESGDGARKGHVDVGRGRAFVGVEVDVHVAVAEADGEPVVLAPREGEAGAGAPREIGTERAGVAAYLPAPVLRDVADVAGAEHR